MNICIGRGRASGRAPPAAEDGGAHERAGVSADQDYIPRVVPRPRPADRQAVPAWQAEELDDRLSRSEARRVGGAARADFDPKRVGEACRAALRNNNGQGGDLAEEPDWHADEAGRRGGRGADAELAAPSKEPWWRTQISQQMDHARIESTERQRRQRIASVLADNEQHRRMTEQAALEMEDEQERLRRREFAKIVLVEEQHTRVREGQLADSRDEVERHRRRRWAVQAIRAGREAPVLLKGAGLSLSLPVSPYRL
jgi:hypothetical protein